MLTYYTPAELIEAVFGQLDIMVGGGKSFLDAPTAPGKTLPAGDLVEALQASVVVSNPPFRGGEPDDETCALN